jgi:hypothetical protein
MNILLRTLTTEEALLIAGGGPTEPDSTFVIPSWPPVFQPTPNVPGFYVPD